MGSHEGLGLGFYESIYCGTPILTMNWTPNNELITDNINSNNKIILVTHQIVCNIILKIVTKDNSDVKIDTTYNYTKGNLTKIFANNKWIFKPINWNYS